MSANGVKEKPFPLDILFWQCLLMTFSFNNDAHPVYHFFLLLLTGFRLTLFFPM
jgi:hypothetical protein